MKRLLMIRGNSLFWHGGLGHRQLFQGVEVRKPPYFSFSFLVDLSFILNQPFKFVVIFKIVRLVGYEHLNWTWGAVK